MAIKFKDQSWLFYFAILSFFSIIATHDQLTSAEVPTGFTVGTLDKIHCSYRIMSLKKMYI